jgi:hypothetical protein
MIYLKEGIEDLLKFGLLIKLNLAKNVGNENTFSKIDHFRFGKQIEVAFADER